MAEDASITGQPAVDGLGGVAADWSGDKQAFPVPWGKAMMWIFLLSDTFVFGCFLTSYMTMRSGSAVPWPNARGIAPNSAASVVIMIGRKRSAHARSMASFGVTFS